MECLHFESKIVEPGAISAIAFDGGEETDSVAVGVEGVEVLAQDGAGDSVAVGEKWGEDKARGGSDVLVVELVERVAVVEGELCSERVLAHIPEVAVEDDDVSHLVRVLGGPFEGDGGSEVVDDEGYFIKTEVLHELSESSGVVGWEVGGGLGLFGEAEAEVIGGDTAVGGGEGFDGSAEEEGPGHAAVNEDDGVSLAFVNVVHPAFA